ncbi:hypothetical protein TSUD_355020 [Trifolium subterraneum]|uniref:Uncharacterized protein n=1 Tax=Trifolium subterraneum TaxID=3900 RepID=A0A2Z6MDI9_TRISU|nr:hypothetical protein TSUD_355020 [Trifolium subterraneum]
MLEVKLLREACAVVTFYEREFLGYGLLERSESPLSRTLSFTAAISTTASLFFFINLAVTPVTEVMDMSIDVSKSYVPDKNLVKVANESLVDINLNQNTELWLLNWPLSKNDVLADINGKELSLKLDKSGALASFEGTSGKAYEFVSHAFVEPEETVFISSPTETKIAGKISRRVSVVHYPDPKELEKISSTDANPGYSAMARTSTSFSIQTKFNASASKGSRPKSSLSELPEQSNTLKGKRGVNKSNGSGISALSRGHSSGISALSRGHSSGVSAVSFENSHGGKSKKRKQTE